MLKRNSQIPMGKSGSSNNNSNKMCSNKYNPNSTVLYLGHLSTVRNNLFLYSELIRKHQTLYIHEAFIKFSNN